MFRELRRKKNAIDIPTVKALLQSSRRGVLAVNGDDGYPYAVPINYFYDEPTQKIYFHGARAGSRSGPAPGRYLLSLHSHSYLKHPIRSDF